MTNDLIDRIANLVESGSLRLRLEAMLRRPDSEDIIHDIWLAILRNKEQFIRNLTEMNIYSDYEGIIDDRKLDQYLTAFFQRAALGRYRQYARSEHRFQSMATDGFRGIVIRYADEPEAIVMAKETQERLGAAIGNLESGPREAATAEIFQGKTVAEIAEQLNKSKTTVRKYLKRAHQKLREEFALEGELCGTVQFLTPVTPAEEDENG
jgi:RNA polymerase sigma factor (sigma-70 family)